MYNLYNLHKVCLLETLGPIDRTPGIPGSDKNGVIEIILGQSIPFCFDKAKTFNILDKFKD